MAEDTYKCQRCGDDSDDLRTLWHACLYDMNELNVPFRQRQIQGQLMTHIGDEVVEMLGRKRTVAKFAATPDVPPRGYPFYTLRVCKSCRGSWMAAIEHWFQHVIPDPSPGTGIFVRRNGANVEITEEEFYASKKFEAGRQQLVDDLNGLIEIPYAEWAAHGMLLSEAQVRLDGRVMSGIVQQCGTYFYRNCHSHQFVIKQRSN